MYTVRDDLPGIRGSYNIDDADFSLLTSNLSLTLK